MIPSTTCKPNTRDASFHWGTLRAFERQKRGGPHFMCLFAVQRAQNFHCRRQSSGLPFNDAESFICVPIVSARDGFRCLADALRL